MGWERRIERHDGTGNDHFEAHELITISTTASPHALRDFSHALLSYGKLHRGLFRCEPSEHD
jgi:hypothetical protein